MTRLTSSAAILWLFACAVGWIGRLLIALSGVVMVVLNARGLYVWWVKWRMRRRSRRTVLAAA